MGERTPHIVLCVKWGHHTIPNSTKHQCAGGCGSDVAMSPATVDSVFDFGGIPSPMCKDCVLKSLKTNDVKVMPISELQLKELITNKEAQK